MPRQDAYAAVVGEHLHRHALPFVFIAELQLAMRVSAAIAITMLFLCGYGWGRYGGLPPWRAGLIMVLLGVAVEAVVIALGG